ncbi:MAG: acetolactate synthase large subunit [Bacillota bacterium]|nr:acetolactate synthase large subunit [Bacillota bacterium]
MKTSDLLVKCLEEEQVEYIFGIPGEETIDIMESLRASKIDFIPVRHEQGAAFMADVYGRLTGKAGVCLATLGPGATNLITGIADANLDRAPLVAITGQTGMKGMHKESHQYIDVVEIIRPITKWNAQIRQGEVVPEVIRKAFKIAQREKPGATHIELPEDLAEMEVNEDIQPFKARPTSIGSPETDDIERAVAMLKEAKKPLILAGNGVIRAKASEELVRFAEANNIPVANTFMGKGVIPYTHPLALMTIGLQAYDYVACGFDAADLIITVGYDFVEYEPSHWNDDRNKKIIHIDTQPAEVDSCYRVELEIVADLRKTLTELTTASGFDKSWGMVTKLREMILEELSNHHDSTEFPVKPQKLIHDLRHCLADDDILISDVGAHKMWIARMYPATRPNTAIISNGYATMGFAVPGGVAAKLAHPNRKVVAVTGDGGFMMNSQEIETALRIKTPFVIVIVNDGGYGLIKWKQENKFGKYTGIEFTNPDFVKYAESFGAKGYRVEKTTDFIPILKQALADEVVAVIDVPVDYSENLKLTSRLGKHICPI